MVEFIPVDHDPFGTAVSANDPTAFHPPQQTTPEGYPYVQAGAQPSFPEVAPTEPQPAPQTDVSGEVQPSTQQASPPLTVSTRRSPYDPYIDTHANRVGIDPNWMRRIMAIESGGDPYNATGSYRGLFQLSTDEFRRNGGQGNIYDPEQNTAAAANKLAREASEFRALYGREPSLTDLYMVHQQGAGGYDAHMSYPDAPAWENMYSTAEGRQKGSHWAKQAIWGNLPDAAKRYYGSVENVSSRDFVNTWRGRVEGGTGPQLVPVDYDPWEASAGRVRARYPTREPDPASLAASSGGVGWGMLLADRYQRAIETPQRAFESAGELQRTGDQYNPQPVLSAAGMAMTGGMPFARPGSVGVFGGRMSQTANTAMLARAEEMAAAGAPRESIWNQTGWFQGADGKWRYEIPDQNARLVPSKPGDLTTGFGPLAEVVEHPDYFAAYPQTRGITTDTEVVPGSSQRGFIVPSKSGKGLTPEEAHIYSRGPDKEQVTSSLLHEMQHGVQEIEGFAPGAAPSAQGVGISKAKETRLAKGATGAIGKKWEEMTPEEQQGMRKAVLFELYQMHAGEVEARNVQTRKDFEHRQVPPWTTEDIPRERQLMPSPTGKIGPVVQKFEPVEHDPFAFEQHPGIISTRYPTGKTSLENPLTQRLTIDTDAMRADPEQFKHNIMLVRRSPLLTKAEALGKPDEVATRFTNKVKDNLLWLHDRVPAEIRERSKLWYDGANRIVNERAKEYDLPPASVSGVYAAMSPQKDWFQNVSLGDRVLDTYFRQGDFRFSSQMQREAEKAFGDPKYRGLLKLVQDRTLNELKTPGEKAMWVRLYDQAHRSPSYPIVAPEGEFGLTVTNKSGTPSRVAWGSLAEIAKAVGAIDAKGDASALSVLMGERHKVRNFYNNMLHPNAPYGDVTIDTHAVAAALLRPLSGHATEVSHNFGNYPGKGVPRARSSALSGASGLYGLYADAYRLAASERGILPRELQSITWEAVRGLFPDVFKSQQRNVGAIDKMWHDYRAGKATLNATRKRVYDYAGGIQPPAWHGQ